MITIIGGGFSGLSAAYFLHRAGKDVTLLEWSRGLGGRASTRNVGYRTMDSGAQRIDLTPLSANNLETEARTLLKAVAEERGVLAHAVAFPAPVFRFDGRSIRNAHQVEVPNWSYIDGGMKAFADALARDIPVRTHTRISDIVIESNGYQLRNQRGETTPSEGVVIALPAPYALALLLPHAASNKKIKRICDLFNDVNYEPMIGAMFGTSKIDFPEPFSALFTDDVTAPIFWLSQESLRRPLGIRKNEMAFVLQLGAEISRDYVLKSDKETFIAVERVFEEVLDVALPDITYGEIQRWPAAFLSSSPFSVDTIKEGEFKAPLYLAGDYVAGQSSIASAFWSGKEIADRIMGLDTFKFIAEPVRAQSQLAEEEWKAVVPPARAPRKTQKPQRKHAQKKYDAEKGKRVFVAADKRPKKQFGKGPRTGAKRPERGPQRGGWQQQPKGRPRQQGPGRPYGQPSGRQFGGGPGQGRPFGGGQGQGRQYGGGQGQGRPYGGGQGQGRPYGGQRPARPYGQPQQGRPYGQQQQGRSYGQQQGQGRPQRPNQGRQWGGGQGQGRGYGQQGGGYGQQPQNRPYGQGRPQQRPRPQQGGYRPQPPGPGGPQQGGGIRQQRGQVVYSTNVRPSRPGGYNPQPRTSGYEGNEMPRRPRRPLDDDTIGNR